MEISWLVGGCKHVLFSISYMGCHPNPIDEVHHFSRCLLHHQPEGIFKCKTKWHPLTVGIHVGFSIHHPWGIPHGSHPESQYGDVSGNASGKSYAYLSRSSGFTVASYLSVFSRFKWIKPLVIQHSHGKLPIEIDVLPIEMVAFHIDAGLPEGI